MLWPTGGGIACFNRIVLAILLSCAFVRASPSELAIAPQAPLPSVRYYWESAPVGGSATLVTLFCSSCGGSTEGEDTVPLVSVLRDTLGDDRTDNDRITYVWLLSLTRQNIGHQLLAGVPFFYWRVGDGSTHVDEKHAVKPLMDLTKPEEPMAVQVMRDVLQWTVLDPLSMPVRASSRAYSTNEVARERAHLQEAIGYLKQAPKNDEAQGLTKSEAQGLIQAEAQGLTKSEADTVIARLALRESLLGGLVGDYQVQRVGQHQLAAQETIRTRNWDLLRGFAEKTGLLFESLDVSGASDQYGLLWFPADRQAAEPVGSPHGPAWKALNIRDPWTDDRLRNWEGPVFERSIDENGALLPAGVTGARQIKVIPLAAYSLTYPKFPLLMIDFRDKLHVRRNEMTQRSITEVTSGIIGISHFTNWYYYAAASAYDFIASRHGRAMDAALRLDSYSQFRSALALDNSMDPALRSQLRNRIDSVSLNPLEGTPDHDLRVARAQYQALLNEASSGKLAQHLDKAREAELANYGKTPQTVAAEAFTFGLFSRHYNKDADLIRQVDRERRVQADLNLLHAAADGGPNPEIAYDSARLRSAVQELSGLLPSVISKNVRSDAAATLKRLNDQTKDAALQADCSVGLAALRPGEGPGIAASSRAVGVLHSPDLAK